LEISNKGDFQKNKEEKKRGCVGEGGGKRPDGTDLLHDNRTRVGQTITARYGIKEKTGCARWRLRATGRLWTTKTKKGWAKRVQGIASVHRKTVQREGKALGIG